MSTLFDAARHTSLDTQPWSEPAARAAIARITDDAFAAFDPRQGWPAHALDDPGSADERFHDVYCGSGGVIWALTHLARAGAIDLNRDFTPFVAGLVERNHRQMGQQHGTQSFLLGDSGLLMLQWLLSPSQPLADRLLEVVRSNLRNTALEQLWGSPGSLLAAIFMAEATGRPEWTAVLREGVQILWQQMQRDDRVGGAWLWVQDLYGRQEALLGAGHGFAGNLHPVLRGAALLAPELVQAFADRALHTLQLTARREGETINWPPEAVVPDRPVRKMLVQDCHGAPGLICRLARAPRSAAWNELLCGAGELTWQAGPLTKGVGPCHGTAGSALAMLKLWRRSGDALWLARGRALALHAVGQVEEHRRQYGMGRYSLWTGDLGLACVLWACISGSDRFPSLDVV